MKHKLTALIVLTLLSSASAEVLEERVPEGGIQPQVMVTTAGVAHLVYLKGPPSACDVRYTSREVVGGEWAAPITVNSAPRSAIAVGTMRGAQLALGKDDSVQVIWNGNTGGKKEMMMLSPLLHARLLPGTKAFSPQQNLMGDTTALDGCASIAANGKGHIRVVWHGSKAGENAEGKRLVWLRNSADDGVNFSPAIALNLEQPGVCACCSLRAHLAPDDALTVLYRTANRPSVRGMTLITHKAGRTTLTKLDDWRMEACPMSSASLLPVAQTLRAAWENEGRIVTGLLGEATSKAQKIGPKDAKHPALAMNAQGQTLVTSVTGSGWAKAGLLHWDILDANGKATTSGDGGKLPVWSYAASYARPDGSFIVLF